MTIFPLQDLLKLDDTARLNYPGTVGSPNWEWKLVNMDWMKTIKFGQ
jgi:4-alpha-glucanotransferase